MSAVAASMYKGLLDMGESPPLKTLPQPHGPAVGDEGPAPHAVSRRGNGKIRRENAWTSPVSSWVPPRGGPRQVPPLKVVRTALVVVGGSPCLPPARARVTASRWVGAVSSPAPSSVRLLAKLTARHRQHRIYPTFSLVDITADWRAALRISRASPAVSCASAWTGPARNERRL